MGRAVGGRLAPPTHASEAPLADVVENGGEVCALASSDQPHEAVRNALRVVLVVRHALE